MIAAVLVRFAHLAVSHAFAALWLLRMSDREEDVEILALRHQLVVLRRQLGDQRPRLRQEDRALLAALLEPLARVRLRRFRLLGSPDTVLRWHRDLMKRRHACASVNPSWGYRRIHGELALLGVAIAASTVWEILKAAGVDPAPRRATATWTDFLRSQAEAILPMDFIENVTLTGQRQYILAAIHHAHLPRIRFLIRDRDAKYPRLIGKILDSAEIATVLAGVRIPRMSAIMERWVKTLRAKLLDHTLIWNQAHLRHALREYERHYNEHRTHRSLAGAAALRVRSKSLEPDQIEHLSVDRQGRLGGVIHEYYHAA